MTTGEDLHGSNYVWRIQSILHEKAKPDPDFRFYTLSDKVWSLEFLWEAYQRVGLNAGAAGVDGETFDPIEDYGMERWLGELSRDLREKTYTPRPVRQVRIPKKQPGAFRPLGIPCIRDRVAQTSARLVLEPIFEADLQPEQYAYRPERSANDAVTHVHRLLNTGHHEVVDGDLSNYFGEIPHADLMTSFARRISDGYMLKLIKAWLEMPTEETDGRGGKIRSARARKERKGTPQGAPISPLASNITMRRFILGWKTLGYAQRFRSVIVNYADDFVVLGKAPAADMLAAVTSMMTQLKLPMNDHKTRCVRCPEEPFTFLGYRIGRNFRKQGTGAYIGTRPSAESVQRICRTIRAQTAAQYGWMDTGDKVRRLNGMLSGWANYYRLGQVSPAYAAIDAHTTKRLRQWLCRKHKVKSGKHVHFSNTRLWDTDGLIQLAPTTKSFAWAKS